MPGTEYVASDYLRQGGLGSGRSLRTPAHVDEETRNFSVCYLCWMGLLFRKDGWDTHLREMYGK